MIKLYYENNFQNANNLLSCKIEKSNKILAVIFLCYCLFTYFYAKPTPMGFFMHWLMMAFKRIHQINTRDNK